MKRNRKREPLRVGTVSRSILACICIATIGVAYVWQKNQIYRLGDEQARREKALDAAIRRNKMLAANLAQQQSPVLLETRCQQYGLGLTAPREQQVVRIAEPGPEWDAKLLAPAPAPVKPASSVKQTPAKKSTAPSGTKTLARR
jgi:hypothetical protein